MNQPSKLDPSGEYPQTRTWQSAKLPTLDRFPMGYFVAEGCLGVQAYNPEVPNAWLITMGLLSCKGVTVYDPVEKVGLIAHISSVREQDMLAGIATEIMGTESITRSDACIVNAISGLPPDIYPNAMKIARHMIKLQPKTLKIYTGNDVRQNKKSAYIRHIALNLASGEIGDIPLTLRYDKNEAAWSLGSSITFNKNTDNFKAYELIQSTSPKRC